MDFEDSEYPDELVLRFEPHGRLVQYLFNMGDCSDETYESASNEITLKPDLSLYTGTSLGECVIISSATLQEEGLLLRIGEFLETHRQQLINFLLLWDYAETLEIDKNLLPGVERGKVVSEEKFQDWVEYVERLIKDCQNFSKIIDFSGYVANRAQLKLDLCVDYYDKASEREEKNKRRRRRKNFTKAEYIKLGEKAGYRCAICGSSKKLEIDHIHPVSKGGSDDFENLQLLCKICNVTKSNKVRNADDSLKKAIEILGEISHRK